MTLDAFDGHSICRLTTTGRVTGRPHRIEIWFAHDNGTLYMLSGGGDRSDWVRNLLTSPDVEVGVADKDWPGLGRVIDAGSGEDRRARDLVFAKYSPSYGGLSRWRDSALAVAIDLHQGALD